MSQPSFVSRHKRVLLGAVASVMVFGAALSGPQIIPALAPSPAYAQLSQQPPPPPAAQPQAPAAQPPGFMRPASFADVVERVKPAVVSVQARREARSGDGAMQRRGGPEPDQNDPLWRFFREFRDRQFGGPQGPQGPQQRGPSFGTSQGSGFFVSADGFIVTNNHVVADATAVQIVMDDGTRLEARVVGTDPRTDVAVLKVERQQPFPFVSFARNNGVRVGDWVIAIGNPFGLGGTVTAGIVSARGRDIGAGPYDDFIQIDAPVNRGNSGGPTFDANGEVIGINTAIYSPSGGSVGIGFAIPASTAATVVAQLRERGVVTRGWLGVQIQGITPDLARTLRLDRPEGALVAEPQANSPAARAGIRAGDVIVGLNGEPVRDARDLTRRVAGLEPGRAARFDIVRGGSRQTIEVEIGQLEQQEVRARPSGRETPGEPEPSDQNVLTSLGLDLAAARNGVAVVDVDPRGAAAQRGLREGDVILEVGGEAVTTPKDVVNRLRAARTQGQDSILARVRSQGGVRFLALPVARS
jgi:serine protease Do